MHFERQKDGCSWLFFERVAPRIRRKLALVRFDADAGAFGPVERLEATDEELELVKVRMASIRPPKTNERARTMRITVICEGETEARYLAEFAARLGLTDRVEVSISVDKDPAVAFRETAHKMLWKRAIGEPVHDEAWLVFDRDDHAGYGHAFELAQKVPFIRTAFTNPCIEYWFLLHFEKFDGNLSWDQQKEIETTTEERAVSETIVEIVKRIRVERRASPLLCFNTLKQYLPSYEKNGEDVYKHLCGHVGRAWQAAKARPSPAGAYGSDLPLLIDRLCEMAGLTREEAFEAARGPVSGGAIEVPKTEAKAPSNTGNEAGKAAEAPSEPVAKTARRSSPNVCRMAALNVVRAAGIARTGADEFVGAQIDRDELLKDLDTLERHFLTDVPWHRYSDIDRAAAQTQHLIGVQTTYLETALGHMSLNGVSIFKQVKTVIKVIAALRCFDHWVRSLE